MTLGGLKGFRLGPDDALFLDFGGTLAEIGPDREAISLPEPTHRGLEALARHRGGALAIVSGRDLRDLAQRAPAGIWRLGGHGLEVLSPGMEPAPSAARIPNAVLAALADVARRPGVRLEVKGPVVAVHYRASPEQGPACLAAADVAARTVPGHVAQAGKMVVEVKPKDAHKGTALRRLMGALPFAGRRPVMLGDDATDEDAMSAALALGGAAVKVGVGETVASLRAPDPKSVRCWLEREASAVRRPFG